MCPIRATCDCFDGDCAIHSLETVRYSTVNWKWSTEHDSALNERLSASAMPKELISLIKDHAYHAQQAFYITQPAVQNELFYAKPDELLHKKLCPNWYFSALHRNPMPLAMALHTTGTRSKQIFRSLSADIAVLPGLQMSGEKYMSRFEQFCRTVIVDECRIKMQFIAVDSAAHRAHDVDDVVHAASVHIIVLDKDDSVNQINVSCSKIWKETNSMKNVFVFNCDASNKRRNQVVQQIARYWNVPCLSVKGQASKQMSSLYHFAVKYHWFCDVVKPHSL
mmetsp:Transcript_8387/g.13777  ORF Transcript_8387/g.13777 Transcript_8387/m.13777 type:complete len:279 (-) Transcript_8387:679-1515(-)